jgi:hypothetical protein
LRSVARARITLEKLEILRRADAVFIEEIRAGLYHEIWLAFTVLLQVRTVGAERARPKSLAPHVTYAECRSSCLRKPSKEDDDDTDHA